jgi:hypothetical protein
MSVKFESLSVAGKNGGPMNVVASYLRPYELARLTQVSKICSSAVKSLLKPTDIPKVKIKDAKFLRKETSNTVRSGWPKTEARLERPLTVQEAQRRSLLIDSVLDQILKLHTDTFNSEELAYQVEKTVTRTDKKRKERIDRTLQVLLPALPSLMPFIQVGAPLEYISNKNYTKTENGEYYAWVAFSQDLSTTIDTMISNVVTQLGEPVISAAQREQIDKYFAKIHGELLDICATVYSEEELKAIADSSVSPLANRIKNKWRELKTQTASIATNGFAQYEALINEFANQE